MLQVKLLWFALGQLSAMGQWMAAAEYVGDEAMAHKALYFEAMDALLASLNRR